MERESVHEEIGYRTSAHIARPIIDPGAFDYLDRFGRRMSRRQGLATARNLLKEQNARALRANGVDTDNDDGWRDETRLRRRAS